MKKNSRMYFSNIVVLLLLPYLITILINGYDMAVLNQKADSETVLPVILALQISSDYEPETIKAQAVIARSNLYRKIGEKESINRNGDQNKKERDARSEKFFETCRELRDELPSCWSVWEKADKVYEEAVEDTSGQVLTYNGELKLVPYHQISAGQTRDGETAFHNEEYAYLKAVDSNSDKTAPGYLNSTYIAKQQLPVELRIVEREDSGYVVSLMADENILEAESFVTGMGIASSDFSMQKMGEQVRFLSKGKGHGLGFSQYGGNKLAKEGNPDAIHFPRAKVEDAPYDFSFSGVKSAVLNYLNGCQMKGEPVVEADVAASFQKAVCDVLVDHQAVKDYKIPKLAMAGGVASNSALREAMKTACEKRNIPFYYPSPILCTDNAAMIGAAAYYEYMNGSRAGLDLNAVPNLKLGER